MTDGPAVSLRRRLLTLLLCGIFACWLIAAASAWSAATCLGSMSECIVPSGLRAAVIARATLSVMISIALSSSRAGPLTVRL